MAPWKYPVTFESSTRREESLKMKEPYISAGAEVLPINPFVTARTSGMDFQTDSYIYSITFAALTM